jgi:hypothetical protein
MSNVMQEYLKEYEVKFKKEAKKRSEAIKAEEKVANLGVKIIDKKAREIMKKFKFDYDKLDKENEKLNKALFKQLGEIRKPFEKIPPEIAKQREKVKELMRQQRSPGQERTLIDPPAHIFCYGYSSCTPSTSCICDHAYDEGLSRIYPLVVARGVGNSEMRYSEVRCEFVYQITHEGTQDRWEYTEVSPCIYWSGRRVITLEYHCYANTDGTGSFFDVSMFHAVPDLGVVFPWQSLGFTIPYADGLRIDGTTWPTYVPMVRPGHPTFYHVRFTIRANARSRFAYVNIDFAPPGGNYIEIPTIYIWP